MDKKLQGKTKMPQEKCRRQDQIIKKQTDVDSMEEVRTLIALLSDPCSKRRGFCVGLLSSIMNGSHCLTWGISRS